LFKDNGMCNYAIQLVGTEYYWPHV